MRLSTLPGLEIALRVDGQDLREYDRMEDEGAGEDSNPTVVTRYVEAISGANFSVEFRPTGAFRWPHNELELCVHLDGVWATGKVYHPRAATGGHSNKSVSGANAYENGQYVFRNFAFADLHTSE